MRILMVEKTRVGGVHVHVSSVAKELRKLGHEVNIITRVEDLGFSSFVDSYSAMKKFFAKKAQQYDIIHAHDWSIVYPAIRAGVGNLVATFHGLPTTFIAKYFQDTAIRALGSRAVVISPRMLITYPSATYVPNGIDPNIFLPNRPGKQDEVLVLGVAQKYYRREITRVATDLGFRVHTAEGIPYSRMPEFYNSVDVFVSIPPRTTGFNMVWLEAMACEVPYIIGMNVGIGEILPIYKVNGIKELKTLLTTIKEGNLPPLKGSRKWVIENGFTWAEHARQIVRIYSEVVV